MYVPPAFVPSERRHELMRRRRIVRGDRRAGFSQSVTAAGHGSLNATVAEPIAETRL
jgi:hypothetical protein